MRRRKYSVELIISIVKERIENGVSWYALADRYNIHHINLHIWAGYLDDILREPNLSGEGWTGLTRDYHQAERAFSGSGEEYLVSPDEYLADIEQYQSRRFDAPETRQMLELLILLMKFAIDKASQIIVKVD